MNDGLDDQIRYILDNIPERLILVEQGIDSHVQQEYLKYTNDHDFSQYSEGDIAARIPSLFSPNTSFENKKETLAILAHQGTLEAYKNIERFLETKEESLEGWAALALQECRMFLESSLSDRIGGILMTGLGGENNRLRYFVIIRSRNDATLTNAQKETIKLRFSYICSKFDSRIEEIQAHQYYVTMEVLISMDVAVAEIIEGGIAECAAFGDFLDENYYVTNAGIPSETEILHYLGKMGKSEE
jgi:hypothetical protein